MRINLNEASLDDLHRYFMNTYIVDPHTNLPAQIIGIDMDENRTAARFRVHTYEGKNTERIKTSEVVYSGSQADPFFDLSLYSKFKLGYKSAKNGKLLVYMSIVPPSIGSRGLTHRKLNITRDYNNTVGFPDIHEDHFRESAARLAWLSMTEETTDPKEAVAAILSGKVASVVINPDVALVLSMEDDCSSNPVNIMYRERVGGKISVDGKVSINKEARAALEEVFGNG